MEEEFDDIRSYRDHEAQAICKQLFSNEEMRKLLFSLLPEMTDQKLDKVISEINSLWDFQHNLTLPLMQQLILPTFDELTVSGLENLDPKKAYLFISNHRDIVLDSAILNYFLHINDFSTAEIAIGDNLVKEEWIKHLVRLNKSFLVRRGLDKMEMLRASKKLSAYIKDTITNRNESVWIAQRAGRAKDGNDLTNRGLITMFGMSAEGDVLEHYAKLNIVPVSISYELDPCDGRKAQELYIEETDGVYEKSEKEDVDSMKYGIILPKGKGHIHFEKELSEEILQLPHFEKKSQMTNAIGELIDEKIQSNYKIWPTNYIASASLSNESTSSNFSEAQKEKFMARLDKVLGELEGDKNTLKKIILGMYQQPLINYQQRKEKSSIS